MSQPGLYELIAGTDAEGRSPGTSGSLSQEVRDSFEEGIALFHRASWQEALEHFDHAALTCADDPVLHNYRARTLEALGRYEEALQSLDCALAINPSSAADLRNRGVILKKLGRVSEALASYEQSLALRPKDIDVLVRRGLVLNELDRRDEALANVNHALNLKPDDVDLLNSRIMVLDNLERYDDALLDADRILAIDPEHIDAINNTGMLLSRLGRFPEALTCYNRSLTLKADQPQARYNRSLITLALGDWIRGFQEFETRWEAPPLNRVRLSGLGTLWLGDQDVRGKTILLHHEQGYGDTLLCARYVPLLAQRGAIVLLAVPPALHALMETLPGVGRVISDGRDLPPHDFHCPLMSLPLAFRTTPDTIPSHVPYLRPDPALVTKWAQRLGAKTRARIGLAWAGRRYAPLNYPRDLPFQALRPLLDIDAEFISLQKDMSESDRATLAKSVCVRYLDDSVADFADTAALMMHLDLVISVDTAVVHLAGALDRPTWLMNRYSSCWRWLHGRTDSPWYPSLRQFRQPALGDWNSVVAAIRDAAVTFVQPLQGRCVAASPQAPRDLTGGSSFGPARACKPAHNQKIRFICATRVSDKEFFKETPLGRSLQVYRRFARQERIELRLFCNNQEGLSTLYNTAIDETAADPAVLIFIHDDVYLSDFHWAKHVREGLQHFDIIGLAGNRRRVPRQPSWMYLDDRFTRDDPSNLSGVVGHGDPFPDLLQLSIYGEPGQEVKLLDGVLLAARSQRLLKTGVRFDPRFKFHFYDLDFCRQAELRELKMGTWAIALVHKSGGRLGEAAWRAAYNNYLQKYGE